jgi:hypothetical protein
MPPILKTLKPETLLVAAAISLAALGAGVATASAQEAEAPKPAAAAADAADHRRMALPSLSPMADHPFTIEVPVNWVARRSLQAPGVFLGPPSGTPDSHPEMLLVRETNVALDAPELIIENLRRHDEAAAWSLREAEVRDFGGVQGLWIVRAMPPEGFHGERVSFAVKLPLGDGSLDVAATVPAEDYDTVAPRVESMLRSLRPAEAEAATAPAPSSPTD